MCLIDGLMNEFDLLASLTMMQLNAIVEDGSMKEENECAVLW